MEKQKRTAIRRTQKTCRVGPFTRERWEHWAEVCRYMDAQPFGRIAAPFPDDPPISFRLLSNMAQFHLVRHRNSDCLWQVSPRWEHILQCLRDGLPVASTAKEKAHLDGDPFVVDFGVDTMYVNILLTPKTDENDDDDLLPLPLLNALTTLKSRAQVEYKPAETPWQFGGKVLSIYPNGKGTGQTGGVSWGYILRNDLVELRIRKKPLNGIIAMVHFSAECLWLNGPKPSLDLMQAGLRRMWFELDTFSRVRYQLSQIHLCADIAHFPLTDAYLPNLVTHSYKRTVYLPSHADLALDDSMYDEQTSLSDDDEWLYDGMAPPGWGDEDVEDSYTPPDFSDEDEFADEDDDQDEEDDEERDDEDEPAAEWHAEGAKVHWRGKAMEGIGFSPASDLSAAWYDKILEERKALHKKAWMREIHKAGGWEAGIRLTRVEIRYRRGILNELEVAYGTEKGARWYDDPYEALDHLGEMWGFGVGFPPEFDLMPDATHRGWMRLAVPDPTDTNQSRWPTDPLWQVVQRVPFAKGVPKPLKRAKQVKPDLTQLDAEILGMFITRSMLRGAYLQAPAELARELEAFEDRMHEQAQEKVTTFSEAVRERARMAGKKLPYKAPLELPKRPRGRPTKRDRSAS